MTDENRVYLALGVFAEMGEFDIKLTTDRSPINEHGENTIIVDEDVFHALIREAHRAGWTIGRHDTDRQTRLADWYERREQYVSSIVGDLSCWDTWGNDTGKLDLLNWEKENPKP